MDVKGSKKGMCSTSEGVEERVDATDSGGDPAPEGDGALPGTKLTQLVQRLQNVLSHLTPTLGLFLFTSS